MQDNKSRSQLDLLTEYYRSHPNKDIEHPEIVDWATSEWKKRTGKVFRDPDGGIRQLHQRGYLIKVRKGVYRYDSKAVKQRQLYDFTPEQKQQILKRDDYKCVVCGKGKKDSVELHVDHIISKDLGGETIVENGETLCSQHNFQKKNYKQTESAKKMFIRWYQLAKRLNDKERSRFFSEILKVYEKFNVNGHITWEE